MGPAHRIAGGLGLAALLLFVGDALAADAATVERLDRIELQVASAEDSLSRVERDLTRRAGFLGAEEARRRFENAVYHYLVGEYDTGAKEFFTLVESGAFPVGSPLLADSQWYLAECLFELGNHALAEEAFQGIISAGPNHPFFRDAVRRELELYGLTGQGTKFYGLYDNVVQPTDIVRYTVGKSFYRQGEYVRAKSMLGEIPSDSLYFGRSRYLLGTILVVEGSYSDAIPEFEKASGISVDTAEHREIVDLANLALGRLHYEQGDFIASSEYYQRISRQSQYFADALYEIGWTFIKQGDYQQALQSVEIFLLAFPEHRYTAQLKLLHGHLSMKEAQFEQALSTYQGVVDEYSPVHDAIQAIEQDAMKPMEWFDTLVELDSIDRYYGEDIPGYAVEMLASQPEVYRAVEVHRELRRQKQEIEESEQLIVELNEALRSGSDALTAFQSGRSEIGRLDMETVRLKGELLAAEEAWLLLVLPENLHAQVRSVRAEREKLMMGEGGSKKARDAASAKAEDSEARAEKVRKDAAKVAIQVEELDKQADELQGRMVGAELSDEDRASVSARLGEVKADLEHARGELARLQSEQVKLEASASQHRSQADSAGNSAMIAGYDGLHDELAALRRHAPASEKDTARLIDGMWARLSGVDSKSESLASRLGSLESTELASIRRTLDRETREVSQQKNDYVSRSAAADRLADEVTRDGLNGLRVEFSESVLEADKGIVDVYWVKKVTVSDERRAMNLEREALLRELNQRFSIIRQGLPEPTQNLPEQQLSDDG